MPIARRSAIHPTVIVVSGRKRAAKATSTESHFEPSFEISFLQPPPLQLLPKLLLAQTPTAPDRLELLAFLRPAPFL